MNFDKKMAIIKEHLEVENGKFILFRSKSSNNKQKTSKKTNSDPYACEECGATLIRTTDGIYACCKCGLERPELIDTYLLSVTKVDKELSELRRRDIEESSSHEWQVY
ncbi:MAG: hypothetical protein QXD55_01310 [Candidatus Aenigmatarchaeota archaeon]